MIKRGRFDGRNHGANAMPKSTSTRHQRAALQPGHLLRVWGRTLLLEAQQGGGLWRGCFLEGSSCQRVAVATATLSEAAPVAPSDVPAALAERLDLLTRPNSAAPLLPGYSESQRASMASLLETRHTSTHLAEGTTTRTAEFALRVLLERLLRQGSGALWIATTPARFSFWRSILSSLIPAAHLEAMTLPDRGFCLLTYAALHQQLAIPAGTLMLLDEPPIWLEELDCLGQFVQLVVSAERPLTSSSVRLPDQPALLTPQPLLFRHGPRAAALVRDFNLFAHACDPPLSDLPAARQALAWRTLTELGLRLVAEPAGFAALWPLFRAGMQDEQWASSSELEAAWRAYDLCESDPAERQLALNQALRLAGAWFLPFVEALRHELDSLDETAATPLERDARGAAIARLLAQEPGPWLVVTHTQASADQLASQTWPVPTARWTGQMDAAVGLYFAHDEQLLEQPASDCAVLHYDLPPTRAALLRRQSHTKRARFLLDGRYLEFERLALLWQPHDSTTACYHALLAAILLNRPLPEAQLVDLPAPAQGGLEMPRPLSEAALAWFFGAAPSVPRREPWRTQASPMHSASQRLRHALALYRHLGAPQLGTLLDALDELVGRPSRPAPAAGAALDDGNTLQPDRLWCGDQAQLPLFFLRTSPHAWDSQLERVRAWLARGEHALALVTDGFAWIWVPRNPAVPCRPHAQTAQFFADGQDQPDLTSLVGAIRLFVDEPGSFPFDQIIPACEDPPSATHLLDEVLLQLLHGLTPDRPLSLADEHHLRVALTRTLLECLLARHVDGPYPWAKEENPWLTSVRDNLGCLGSLGWSCLHRWLEAQATASFDALAAALTHLRVRFTGASACVYPQGHHGPAIPIARLRQLDQQSARGVLQRWRKHAKDPKVTFLPAHQDDPPVDEHLGDWLESAWPEATAAERVPLLARWRIIPAGTWYLTHEEESDPRPARAVTASLLEQGLAPLLLDAQRQLQPPEALRSLRLCDPCYATGAYLEAALTHLGDRLWHSAKHHQRLTHGAEGWLLRVERGRPLLGPMDDRPAQINAWLRHLLAPNLYGVTPDALERDLTHARLWLSCAPLPCHDFGPNLRCGQALIGASPAQAQTYPLSAWEREAGDEHHREFVHHRHTAYPQRGSRTKSQQRGDVWATALRELRELVRQDQAHWTRECEAAQTQVELAGVAPALSPSQTDLRMRCDLWCALWFWPGNQLSSAPLPRAYATASETAQQTAKTLARELGFVHWSQQFPLGSGTDQGFSAVIGQPPLPSRQSSSALLGEWDPLYAFLKAPQKAAVRRELFRDPEIEHAWLTDLARNRARAHYLRWAGASSTGHAPRATAASRVPELMLTELALHLLRPGGSMVWVVDPRWLQHPRATELRKILLDQWDWRRLILLPSLAALLVRKRPAQQDLSLVQAAATDKWLHGQAGERVFDKPQLARISPHSRSMPLTDAVQHDQLLTRLHHRDTLTLKALTKNWDLVPLAHRRRADAGWRDTGLGYWVRGPWPEGDPTSCSLPTLLAGLGEVSGPAGLDPSVLDFPLALGEGPFWFRTNAEARQALRLPLEAVAALGCLASLPGLFLARAKWGSAITLSRLAQEFPLPARRDEWLLRASAASLLHEPRYAPWRLALPLPASAWDPHLRLRHTQLLDASMALLAGFDEGDCRELVAYFNAASPGLDPLQRARLQGFSSALQSLGNQGAEAFLAAAAPGAHGEIFPADAALARDRRLQELIQALAEKVAEQAPLKIQQSTLPF